MVWHRDELVRHREPTCHARTQFAIQSNVKIGLGFGEHFRLHPWSGTTERVRQLCARHHAHFRAVELSRSACIASVSEKQHTGIRPVAGSPKSFEVVVVVGRLHSVAQAGGSCSVDNPGPALHLGYVEQHFIISPLHGLESSLRDGGCAIASRQAREPALVALPAMPRPQESCRGSTREPPRLVQTACQ